MPDEKRKPKMRFLENELAGVGLDRAWSGSERGLSCAETAENSDRCGPEYLLKRPTVRLSHPVKVTRGSLSHVHALDDADDGNHSFHNQGAFSSAFGAPNVPASAACTNPSVTVLSSSQRARIFFASTFVITLSDDEIAITANMSANSCTMPFVSGISA